MPPVRAAKNKKPPPEGFDDIEDTLLSYANKMRDAQSASTEGKKKHETLWPIFQISHARSRRKPGREVEKARVREVVLFTLCAD
ncbi:Component of the SF3b subcomplex of the U2 snRNP [Lithohypha guttulata]|uniref:Component of the SF3b subcomplex of the U2 snRNP n=1 Tax=Lithohypha guttulata TaxID=1690604 RepID=A0AAN7T6X1_9EURO|nr:Component of the SF3b subcomplex of the U2 snRNP [Lithohypha guttulata]KAK5090847.1 Component of the SF3b subcomplex of the U2 snRNP [Lithohypha guttulata]